METFIQDIRYGFRVLRKSPSFSLIAVLTLALGIGANTAIFSLINALLLRMLPVANPSELVVVGDPAKAHTRSLGTPQLDLFSYPLYRDLRDGNHVFSGMIASGEEHQMKVADDRSGEISSDALGVLVTGNYFSVLGVNAFMGRMLTPEDDKVPGGHPVAVVSYRFWQQKLSADPGIVGQSLRLNGQPFTIVGVAPDGFFGDTVGDLQDVWMPMMMEAQILAGRPWLEDYNASWLRVIGRLRPRVSIDKAAADLNVVFQQTLDGPAKSKIHPDDMAELRKSQIPVVEGGAGFSQLRGNFRNPLWLLMGMVGLVLLIACVNVANLLLARSTARRKEIAIRLSIGASPARLMRQLLTESVLLAFTGGAVGLLVARWGSRALLRLSLDSESRQTLNASLDSHVLLFTALSVLVLFAAGLLVRSLRNLQNVKIGYTREGLLMIDTDPLSAGYNPKKLPQFNDEVVQRLSTLPGVRGVTYSMAGLFSGNTSSDEMKVEGYTAANHADRVISLDAVGPNYFTTLKAPIILGRDLGQQDTATAPLVAVINKAMQQHYFGNSNSIGKKIWADDDEHRGTPPFTIVGVVDNVQDQDLHEKIAPRFYFPLSQYPDPVYDLNFVVRTAGNPNAIVESARKAIGNFDSRVPIGQIRSLDTQIDDSIHGDIVIARLSTFFGLLALLLACIGVYGIMSYAVSGRTREIGVRMALGARRQDVLWMVLRGALLLIAVGVCIGIPAAFAASQLIKSMLFNLTSFDPLSMLAVIILLGGVAILAGLIPARRATKVNPVIALRYE